MIATQQLTCTIEGCAKPRYQRRKMCASHAAKQYRYGNPLWKRPTVSADLTGVRFGSVIAVERMDTTHWRCVCDCGTATRVRAWSLTSGGTTTCGDGPRHHRAALVTYSGAHIRLRTDLKPASQQSCVDCHGQAFHWSYDHADPDELVDAGMAYSLKADHYSPRCVPCHKVFDLGEDI